MRRHSFPYGYQSTLTHSIFVCKLSLCDIHKYNKIFQINVEEQSWTKTADFYKKTQGMYLYSCLIPVVYTNRHLQQKTYINFIDYSPIWRDKDVTISETF